MKQFMLDLKCLFGRHKLEFKHTGLMPLNDDWPVIVDDCYCCKNCGKYKFKKRVIQ